MYSFLIKRPNVNVRRKVRIGTIPELYKIQEGLDGGGGVWNSLISKN